MNAFETADRKFEVCACCDEGQARLTTHRMTFPYGDQDPPVLLTVDVPVWTCDACGEIYTAEGAEEAERAAICSHLGRLTPREIFALRSAAGLTQAMFATMVGVSRVTVARWESGQQLQTAACDARIRVAVWGKDEPFARAAPRFRTDVEHRRMAAAAFDLVAA